MRLAEEKRSEQPDRPREIEAELKKLHRELDRFMSLIAGGHAPERVLAEISQREARTQGLGRELSQWQVIPADELNLHDLHRAVQERIGHFRELLHANVPKARQALNKLLVPKSLRFIPDHIDGKKAFRFEGQMQIDTLLDPGYIEVASPRGFEPLSPP